MRLWPFDDLYAVGRGKRHAHTAVVFHSLWSLPRYYPIYFRRNPAFLLALYTVPVCIQPSVLEIPL
jgi:hypothetical protein